MAKLGSLSQWALNFSDANWSKINQNLSGFALNDLGDVVTSAKELRNCLDKVIYSAEYKIRRPRIDTRLFNTSADTVWSWRPELWCDPIGKKGRVGVKSGLKLGQEVSIFHDCELQEISMRQVRNTRRDDLAPFGFVMDIYNFEGTFFSVAIDFPDGVIANMSTRHIVLMETRIQSEKPLEIFGRLNVRHGPNVEHIVRPLFIDDNMAMIEFDLGYLRLNQKRIGQVWLDLIFSEPAMNQIKISDISFHRRPRAEF